MTPKAVQPMGIDRLILYTIIAFFGVLPIILMPLFGEEVLDAVQEISDTEDKRQPDNGEPVRLVAGPLMNVAGRINDGLVAVIDLPNRTMADALCEKSPYLHDRLQVFAAENPSRLSDKTRISGRDPVLIRVLRAEFPSIPMDAVRLTEPTAYKWIYPSRDVYECQGLSYRRIAQKSYE
ncbi:hypothetical protein [Pacificispira sp.]|uniref:hypothetical protein n=1 Tax=Pacificispira sp. TaxID=2888761 RepID=UPI003BAA34D9